MLLLQQDDQLWTIIAYCNVGLTVIQPKTLALKDGSNWKRKLKIGKVWTSLEMYFKALTGRKELKGARPFLGYCHFSNFGRERGKKMLKKLQRSLSNKICKKRNVN